MYPQLRRVLNRDLLRLPRQPISVHPCAAGIYAVASGATTCAPAGSISAATATCTVGYVHHCPVGAYAAGNTCVTCSGYCVACAGATTCTRCGGGQYLLNGKCLATCDARYVGVDGLEDTTDSVVATLWAAVHPCPRPGDEQHGVLCRRSPDHPQRPPRQAPCLPPTCPTACRGAGRAAFVTFARWHGRWEAVRVGRR